MRHQAALWIINIFLFTFAVSARATIIIQNYGGTNACAMTVAQQCFRELGGGKTGAGANLAVRDAIDAIASQLHQTYGPLPLLAGTGYAALYCAFLAETKDPFMVDGFYYPNPREKKKDGTLSLPNADAAVGGIRVLLHVKGQAPFPKDNGNGIVGIFLTLNPAKVGGIVPATDYKNYGTEAVNYTQKDNTMHVTWWFVLRNKEGKVRDKVPCMADVGYDENGKFVAKTFCNVVGGAASSGTEGFCIIHKQSECWAAPKP